MTQRAQAIRMGTAYVSAADPVMRRLIRTCPPLTTLRLQSNRFAALANSILSQQISVHAARSIRTALAELAGPEGVTPKTILRLSPSALRSAGVSQTKIAYLKDLAEHVASDRLKLNQIGRNGDDRVVAMLTDVKGIGVWTAQMFLIFSLGRLDVFPSRDYGIRAAIQRLYKLEGLPDTATATRIAGPWRPYATIASWYCWRSHELQRSTRGGL